MIAGLLFLALPARLGFPRMLPEDEFYRSVFLGIFTLDQPFNLVPSLHVVYTTAISLAVIPHTGTPIRLLLFFWMMLIASSTVLVHQHHLLDVITGVLLAVLMHVLMGGRKWSRK